MKHHVGLAAVVLFGAFLLVKIAVSYPPTPWRMAGLAIAIPSFVLWIVARVQLGRAFSIRAKARMLVTSGLYARIRNPIYVFSALLLAGMVVWAQRPWWLLIFAVLIPVQALRMREEEQVLEAKFGEEYRAYKRKTWF